MAVSSFNQCWIPIRHDADRWDNVPKIDILTRLLIRDRRSVLFVGEGNFTFTVAFAAYKQYYSWLYSDYKDHRHRDSSCTWGGITATRYESEHLKPLPSLFSVKMHCIETAEVSRESIESLPEVPACYAWRYGIDALDLPPELTGGREVIWFQCPWNNRDDVNLLVFHFLLNAVDAIKEGGYVCVGITTFFPYVVSYKLQQLLGEGLRAMDRSTAILEYYTFCGAEDKLINELLLFGYHHQGHKDIHALILNHHITLVFQRKSRKGR